MDDVQMTQPRFSCHYIWPIVLGISSLVFSVSGQAMACGDNTPAFPVTQNLWLPHWQPVRPGQKIDPRRDSTDYITQTIPSHASGHELYKGLDILDGFLYVVYNAGLQVWDIKGAYAEVPNFRAYADGWEGDFLSWHNNAEYDSFNEDIAVVRYSANQVLIALSGRLPAVGFSLWLFNESSGALSRLYQHNGLNSIEVAILKHTNGKFYALTAHLDGVDVFDVDVAINGAPCLDNASTPQIDCPGVALGSVGTMTAGKHLDVLQTSSGKILLSTSDASAGAPVKVDIHALTNPSNPGSAVLEVSGLSSHSFGTAMFEEAGHSYLAVVQRVSGNNSLDFFNIDACVTGTTCTLGNPLGRIPLLGFTTGHLLTFSRSNGTPFLYYAGEFSNLSGDRVEMLLDLSTIHPTEANQDFASREITHGGPTMIESCANQTISYWGWYHPKNSTGLKNLSPRRGKFNGNYFYRAAVSVLDIHKRSSTSSGSGGAGGNGGNGGSGENGGNGGNGGQGGTVNAGGAGGSSGGMGAMGGMSAGEGGMGGGTMLGTAMDTSGCACRTTKESSDVPIWGFGSLGAWALLLRARRRSTRRHPEDKRFLREPEEA